MGKISENSEWNKEYKRIRRNAVYFIEEYYNKLHPDQKVELTDEERQIVFDRYKGIPLYDNFARASERDQKIRELKEKGYKDWEIF